MIERLLADEFRQLLGSSGLGFNGSGPIELLGDRDLLSRHYLGLFCSIKCPGDLIIQMYDLARALRDTQAAIIGGFHTPMEKESLDFLLRGTQPVAICPARTLDRMRVPPAWQEKVAASQLILLSPFAANQRRQSSETSERRNQFVASIADELLIVFAAPGGRTEALARETIAQGKRVWTLDHSANAYLIAMGAVATTIAAIVEHRQKTR